MNWYKKAKLEKHSGKTHRDDKSNVILWHVSPKRLSSLRPLSKFRNSTGLFFSPSYRSIINDWSSYVMGKKHDPKIKEQWNKAWDIIKQITDNNTKTAKNPEDQPKLDEANRMLDKIRPTIQSEEFEEANKGYQTIYIHKIACPREVYNEAMTRFTSAYKSGYQKDNFGFWGWGEQIFIDSDLLPSLKIISVEELTNKDFTKKYKELNRNNRTPSLKLNKEQEEKFNQEELAKNLIQKQPWAFT